MIKINNINKYFNKGKGNEVHVINDVSLEFEETGLVCILGESGSGKTTLMNTIGGLDKYRSGTIEAYGQTVKNSSSKKYEKIRNNNYGYIFQNYYLLEGQTVYENIKICLNMFEINEEEKDKRINIVLESVGMEKYKKRVVNQLSGGQQQRVAIARALVKSPNVIFADEPTGNLDEENTINVMGILKKVSKNCLIVVVTHEKSIAEFFADRVIEVSDGKIVSDKLVTNKHNTYKYTDNNNIYLKEYNKISFKDDYIKCTYYSDETSEVNNESNKKINLDIIYINGKYYLNSKEDCDIELLSDNSETKVLDEYKPELNLTKVQDNIDYTLEKIEQAKSPKLTSKQIFKLALNNIRLFSKKQFYLVASLLIMSILVVITVNNILATNFINEKWYANHNSHYNLATVKQQGGVNKTDNKLLLLNQYEYYENGYFKDYNDKRFVYIDNTIEFDLIYKGFSEIENLKGRINKFDIVPIEVITKDNLVYGRMPKYPNEIVVDLQVIQKFFIKNKILAEMLSSPKTLIDKQLKLGRKKCKYKICGISDVGEPSIYIDRVEGLGTFGYMCQGTSYSKLKKLYSHIYADKKLKDNEVLVNKSLSMSLNKDYLIGDQVFKVVGYLPFKLDVNYAINENGFKKVLKDVILRNGKFNIYLKERSEGVSKIENGKDVSDQKEDFYMYNITDQETKVYTYTTYKNQYEEDLFKVKEKRKLKFDAKTIIIFATMLVCLVILYYTIKSNTLKNIKNISVYRLLGIKKLSIAMLYVVENIIMSSYTTLVGVLLTSCIFKFLASIPSFQIIDFLSWYVILGTIVVLYMLNVIIGLLPIRGILKLTPAQITAKYDI